MGYESSSSKANKTGPKTGIAQKIVYFLCLLLPWFVLNFFISPSGKEYDIKDNFLAYQEQKIKDYLSKKNFLSELTDGNDGVIDNFKNIDTVADGGKEIEKQGNVKRGLETKKVRKNVVDLADVPQQPVLGKPPGKGKAMPLYGVKHKGTDAIFALACNYPKLYYQRFVGTLRDVGYDDDIVLAVSPEIKMKPGVKEYVQQQRVVAYAFDVDCQGPDNCRLQDDFLGYPDPRPFRTFANIRYALYEYWLTYYDLQSYILILDFRDTFFQAHPFGSYPVYGQRPGGYDLQVYSENEKVKSIGICVFNSMWVKKCYNKQIFNQFKHLPVICSGSTLGSYYGIHHYVRTMLSNFDTVKCWKKGIESDQPYQNVLFYQGHFNTKYGNATQNAQGDGIVNTIGALNGFRVPKEMKGPLDTHWKMRDSDGYIINKDKSISPCVHQWDRWYKEVANFLDRKLPKLLHEKYKKV